MNSIRKYIRYFFYHLKRRFVWWQRWVILIRQISTDEIPLDPPVGYHLRQADENDYPALIEAYPEEFSSHLPEAVKRKQLLARAGRMRCFVVTDQDKRILGACWCSPYRNSAIRPKGVDQNTLFEMMNTFIVPSARGTGLSEVLRRYAIAGMALEGYRAVISFVWYSRIGSLKMNLNTGSKILGEKTLYSVMGLRWSRFRPHVAVNRLPVSFNGSVFLLGSDDAPFYKLSNDLSRFGIRSSAVIARGGRRALWHLRFHGVKVIDRRTLATGAALDLPELYGGSTAYLVALDQIGAQLLADKSRIGISGRFVCVTGNNILKDGVSQDTTALPMAVLHAANIDGYFHHWSANSGENEDS